jgi:hypothetical protein
MGVVAVVNVGRWRSAVLVVLAGSTVLTGCAGSARLRATTVVASIDIVTCAYFLAGASAVDIAQRIAAKVARQ